MKKTICYILLCICICMCLVGCSTPKDTKTNNKGEESKFYNEDMYDDIYEFVDPSTGVHYWIYSHSGGYSGMGGMTPRLNSDGTIMVTE